MDTQAVMGIPFQAMLAKGTIHPTGTAADFRSPHHISICELDTNFPCSSVLQSLNNPVGNNHFGRRTCRERLLSSMA